MPANNTYTNWIKASDSDGGGGCFELSFDVDGIVAVRDSKLGGSSPVLEFTDFEFACFKSGIMKGEFERKTA